MNNASLISGDDFAKWNAVVESFDGCDVYHTAEYHRVAEEQGEGAPKLFAFQDGDKSVAVPFLIRPVSQVPALNSEPNFDATSVYGYPGALANFDVDAEENVDFVDAFQTAFVEKLRELNVVSFFSRQHPLFATQNLFRKFADVDRTGKTVAIDLSLTDEEQLAQMRKDTKYEIRRGFRENLRVVEDADFRRLDLFVEIYRSTMKGLNALQYYFFSPEYFRSLVRYFGPRNLKLLFAEVDGKVVSAYLFFLKNKVVQCHLSGSTPEEHRVHGGKRCVLDYMRRWAKENGYRWLHLGGGRNGKSDSDSLFDFKASFSHCVFGFYTVRGIVRRDVYDGLVAKRRASLTDEEREAFDASDFFPKYRVPLN